jgi:hypothetical protein
MPSRQTNRGDPLRPLLAFLDGKPVPYQEMVAASRQLAEALVSRSHTIIIIGEGEYAGIWDLEQMSDGARVGQGRYHPREVTGQAASGPGPPFLSHQDGDLHGLISKQGAVRVESSDPRTCRGWIVELMGFEPMTSCLPSTRSTN